MAGKSDRETIDQLWKSVDGFRKVEGERGTVPKDPKDYKFEPSDKIKPLLGNLDKDPVFASARDRAQKAGITDKQFNTFLVPLLEDFVTAGLVDKPVDATAQLASMAPAGEYADDAAKQKAGAKRVNDNIAWVDGAKGQAIFGKDASAPIGEFLAAAAASDPRSHQLIEWLRGADVQTAPAMGGQGGGGQTDEQMTARINDPRGNPNSQQFDRAYANETDRLLKQKHG